MASVVDICNIALQKLGAGRITSISQDAVNARACLTAYEHCKKAALERHPWRFATKRASLPADVPTPDWGKSSSFELPADYIRLLNDYPEMNSTARDFEIEGRKIFTNYTAPLEIRYVYDVQDTSLFHPLFCEVLACDMADQMCEALTQSNSKKQAIVSDRDRALSDARKANAFVSIAQVAPMSPWITGRQ